MKQIRFLVALLVIWLLLFFSVDRWGLINTSYVGDVFMLAAVILTIAVPPLQIIPLWGQLAIAIPIFLAAKVWQGYPILDAGLSSTAVEVGALFISITLGHALMAKVKEFDGAFVNLYLGPTGRRPESFTSKQGAIYREVRRARNHRRPLSLMAIGVEEDSVRANIDHLMQEVQRETTKQFAMAGVSRKLSDMLEDCTIIAQEADRFLVLLPEMTPELLPSFVERLRLEVHKQLGLSLHVGTASLDRDGWTFDGLLRKATEEMNAPSPHFQETEPSATDETEYTRLSQRLARRNDGHEASQLDAS